MQQDQQHQKIRSFKNLWKI